VADSEEVPDSVCENDGEADIDGEPLMVGDGVVVPLVEVLAEIDGDELNVVDVVTERDGDAVDEALDVLEIVEEWEFEGLDDREADRVGLSDGVTDSDVLREHDTDGDRDRVKDLDGVVD
jgi:hypothetical protein